MSILGKVWNTFRNFIGGISGDLVHYYHCGS